MARSCRLVHAHLCRGMGRLWMRLRNLYLAPRIGGDWWDFLVLSSNGRDRRGPKATDEHYVLSLLCFLSLVQGEKREC